MTRDYDALALFSGGLDSILAMKTVLSQGLRVLGLHFCSPFFGHPEKIARWQEVYDLEIQPVNIHQQFIAMLRSGPQHGFGKVLNPCVDCKILMLSTARAMLAQYGARFLISGEVLAQRPMSQRRDALNLISNQAQVQDLLLRPLSARHLSPTLMEIEGLVDRSRLHGFAGRGRKDQLRLAGAFGLKEIPTPAGGCLLAEKESAKRFWPVLTCLSDPDAQDFALSNVGRQYWHGAHWLVVGRNRCDNETLKGLAQPGDLLFKAVDVQGPLALGRQKPGADWPETDWNDAVVWQAAAFVARFSEKYSSADAVIHVRVEPAGQLAGRLAGQLAVREQILACPPKMRTAGSEKFLIADF
jgi:hypothetical protein